MTSIAATAEERARPPAARGDRRVRAGATRTDAGDPAAFDAARRADGGWDG